MGTASSRNETDCSSCTTQGHVADVTSECPSNKKVVKKFPTTSRSGRAGLEELGFEYRVVPCRFHAENHGPRPIGGGESRAVVQQGPSQARNTTCFECATRLFHLESGVMVTPDNRREYVPDGPFFDAVSSACQEVAQDRVMREHSLKFVTLCSSHDTAPEGEQQPVKALVDEDYDEDVVNANEEASSAADPVQKRHKPTLLIITGKGISRAGVMSAGELLTSGIEVGSALYHLTEARRRGIDSFVLLDPNARGHRRGMETVELSLTSIFGSGGCLADDEGGDGDGDDDHGAAPGPVPPPLYVLAHSAAGGYLVRYLLLGPTGRRLLRRIRSVAFTDSTHNVQWARDDDERELFDFLQSSRCLYVRNNGVRASDVFLREDEVMTEPGEEADVDEFWRRRFGEVRTVWAGTTEHSRVCWVAREIIWKHFDDNMTCVDR